VVEGVGWDRHSGVLTSIYIQSIRDNTTRLHINLIIHVYKFDSVLNLLISYKSPWRFGRGRDGGSRARRRGACDGRGAVAWRARGGRGRGGCVRSGEGEAWWSCEGTVSECAAATARESERARARRARAHLARAGRHRRGHGGQGQGRR
jgi:hypothetical protein